MGKRRVPPIVRELRELLHQPFTGLTLRTADGESYSVSHSDYIFVAPLNDVVYTFDDDGSPHRLIARHIVSIEPMKPKRSKSNIASGPA